MRRRRSNTESWRIKARDLEKYVRRVFRLSELAEGDEVHLNKAGSRIVKSVVPLFENGRGNDLPGVRGTWWAAYNAVSEHLSHHRGRSQDTRVDSLWFGEANRLNTRALSVATQMAAM